jgi:LmbE family N-acetylglucosaminyl deacetylase
MKRALIIAAHPDDDILGCGATMSRFQSQTEFRVVFIAEGTSCRFSDTDCEDYGAELTKRNNSALDALHELRVTQVFFNNLPCGKLDQVPQIEINKIIEKHVKEFKPDTVFTHWDGDSNIDHRKVHDATVIATRPSTLGSGVATVLCYEVLSSSEWGFKDSFSPNLFFSVTEKDIDNKCSAFRKYYTEGNPWPHPRNDSGIEVLSKFRGMQSGNEFSEAFRILRACK